jgi:hypothetical protein
MLIGSDRTLLGRVHELATRVGFRPVVVYNVQDSDKQVRLQLPRKHGFRCHQFTTLGDLEFGTKVHHAVNVSIHPADGDSKKGLCSDYCSFEDGTDAKRVSCDQTGSQYRMSAITDLESRLSTVEFQEVHCSSKHERSVDNAARPSVSRSSSVMFAASRGLSDVCYENIHVIDCDAHPDSLMSSKYWEAKIVESCRFYVCSNLRSTVLRSMLTGVVMAVCSYSNYYSTLVRDPVSSSFVRSIICMHWFFYSFGLVRYELLHCLGRPEQSISLYALLMCAFPIFLLFGGSLTISDNIAAAKVGDLFVIFFAAIIQIGFVVFWFYWVTGTSWRSEKWVWMCACAVLPATCWLTTGCLAIAYNTIITIEPYSATVLLCLGFPIQNASFRALLKRVYDRYVLRARSADPAAVRGSQSHGQTLPINFCLTTFYTFSELGSLTSMIIGGIQKNGLETAAITIVITTIFNTLHHSFLSRFWAGKVLMALGFPNLSSKFAPNVWDYIETENQFAISYCRFFVIGALFIQRGICFGNWSFDGPDQFAFSSSVFYIYLLTLVGDVTEDIFCAIIHRWYRFDVRDVFGPKWQKLSDDPAKHLSIDKVYDMNARQPSPLFRGVQPVPFMLQMQSLICTGTLAFLLLEAVLGTESVGGPCPPTVDLSRPRLLFHPGFNPTGECDFYLQS